MDGCDLRSVGIYSRAYIHISTCSHDDDSFALPRHPSLEYDVSPFGSCGSHMDEQRNLSESFSPCLLQASFRFYLYQSDSESDLSEKKKYFKQPEHQGSSDKSTLRQPDCLDSKHALLETRDRQQDLQSCCRNCDLKVDLSLSMSFLPMSVFD